jgi:hypothetical protein
MNTLVAFCGLTWLAGGLMAPAEEGPSKPGLVYVFFNDTRFAGAGLQDVDAQVNLETRAFQDFSQLWIGQIQFPCGGEVAFEAEADLGLWLSIGGKTVIDGWSRKGSRQGTITVSAGQRLAFQLKYCHNGGPALMRLYWRLPGKPRELVPAGAFLHLTADAALGKRIAERRYFVTVPGEPEVPWAPQGDEQFKANLYHPGVGKATGSKPLGLGPGPRKDLGNLQFAHHRTERLELLNDIAYKLGELVGRRGQLDQGVWPLLVPALQPGADGVGRDQELPCGLLQGPAACGLELKDGHTRGGRVVWSAMRRDLGHAELVDAEFLA